NSKSVSVSDTAGIKVTANSNAFDGNHSVEVTQLARGASLISQDRLDKGGSSTLLKDMGIPDTGTSRELTIKFMSEDGVPGESIIAIDPNETLAQFVNKVNE